MSSEPSRPLTKLQRNNRIFAIIWILLEILFCVLYGVYVHTSAYAIIASNGLFEYIAAVGIALSTIIGLGGIMSFVSGLKWSGFGFAFLIVVLCFQYYFMINGFWTKADIQNTQQTVTGTGANQQYYGDDYTIAVSEGAAVFFKTLGATATGAFKMALTIAVAFSAVIGRAGPLEILFFVLIGGGLYELNRQLVTLQAYDVGGSFTIFMFGGLMGTVVSILLALTKQKQHLTQRGNYTSSRFNATLALVGSAFFWVFYPTIFLDLPFGNNEGPFISSTAMINAYYAISTTVVTSLALSAVMNGRIRIKDLMYAPFAGAAIIGSSAVHINNPVAAILLGMIAGLLQPIFNRIEERMARGKVFYSTCAPFLFAIQGLIGSLATGILRAIRNNYQIFNYNQYPYPFRWGTAGEQYRYTFVSFGIALGAGAVVGLFVLLVSGQEHNDYYEDIAYWIVNDDGLRHKPGEIKDDDEIKGVHSYLG